MTLRARRSLDRQAPVICAVERLWPGETVVCLGGGPSLTPADVEAVRERARVIAVNNAYQIAPWADVLYAADAAWWSVHKGAPSFTGLKFSLEKRAGVWPGVNVLENMGNKGLELAPTGLRTGHNSGYQSIGLAFHLGAAKVLLLGFDMKPVGGKSHWFGEHPAPLVNTKPETFRNFCKHFQTLVEPLRQQGVTVINCTPESALDCFPKMALRDALPESSKCVR